MTGVLALIGPGRAGSSIAAALEQVGWTVARRLGRGADVTDAAHGVDLVVIATPDGAVSTIAAAIAPDDHAVVLHLAGSLGLDVLGAHPRRAALHPLMALPDAAVGVRRLRAGGWFAVAGDPMARTLAESLGGRVIDVADADRAAYHAAACVASNHLVALLAQAERLAALAGVGLDAYLDLVRATVENVAEVGPAAALTGPAARGDTETLDRHRAVIDVADPSGRAFYDAAAEACARLAGR